MHFPHSHRSSYFTVYRDGVWKIVYHYAIASREESGAVQLSEGSL
ncbi:hypothetical protein [Rubritalea tangerina]